MDEVGTCETNRLRQQLAASQSLASICILPSPDCAETMARAGFDWLMLDMQHSMVNRETMAGMIRALDVTGTPALVRASACSPDLVGWVLDAGAQGVVAPMIDTADEARRFIAWCRYGPQGTRSWGPMRALAQGKTYRQIANSAVACVMLETRQAMENLEAIVAVDGLDLVFVGQSDLALSYGLEPGEGMGNAAHVDRLARIASVCARRQVPAAINCHSANDAKALHALGFRHLLISSDLGLLRRSAGQALESALAALT